MILITGLTGTSGRAFYKVLCENNYKEKIRVVVRPTTDLSVFENTPLDLEFVVGDIEDLEFLRKSIRGVRLVFHIAAKDKSQKIVEAICESTEKPFACLVSSTIVFSNYYRTSYLKQDENTWIEKFNKSNIKYVFIRPTMIFGSPNDKNISVFSRWIKKYRYFPIVHNGIATIQPVHKNDLADAYYKILVNYDRLTANEYIVSGKNKMTLLEMLNLIGAVLGTKTTFINIPFWLARIAVNAVYFFSLKRIDFREKLDRLTEDRAYPHDVIAKELGYLPISFKERLQETIDTYHDYV